MLYNHKNGVSLRMVEESDLTELKDLKDESWFGTHSVAFTNERTQKKWFDSLINDRSRMVLIAYHDTVRVGVYKVSNLDWMNRSYESAHDIFKSYRRKGLGKLVLEAGVDFGFEVLNINRIDTEVLENNIASMKNALYAGFLEYGVRKKAVVKCRDWLDSICLGITNDQWSELERVKKMDGICNLSYSPTKH